MDIPGNNYSLSDYGQTISQRIRSRSQSDAGKAAHAPTGVSEHKYEPLPDNASGSSQQAQEVRARNYIEAVRELKAQELNPKRAQASNTFLEIAHFDNAPRLVDVYA